jgi:hypothetical protein
VLFRCLLALVVLWMATSPEVAVAQAVLRRYVGRDGGAVMRSTRPRTHDRRAVTLARRVADDGHVSESHVARRLGGDVYAVYTRSQIHPRHHDRFRLFRVDRRGRAREVPVNEAYAAATRDVPYEGLVVMWRETVRKVLTQAYRHNAELRVQVDTELRFLEHTMIRRAPGPEALPWEPGTRPASEALSQVGNGARLRRALTALRRPGAGTIDMLERDTYRVYDTHRLPRREFAQLLRDGRDAREPFLTDERVRDHTQLARRNSALARRVEDGMHGYQFADQRSALVRDNARSVRSTALTVVHELNHGANRVPRRANHSDRATLAFEFTAAAAEARASGQPARLSALRELKQDIIDTYGLDGVHVDSVADRPHGTLDNWVPKFPRGEEQRYAERYFGATRPGAP